MPRPRRNLLTEHNRAEAAEEEVRKQMQEILSQGGHMNVYLGEIANLKRRIPKKFNLTAAKLRIHGVWAHGPCRAMG